MRESVQWSMTSPSGSADVALGWEDDASPMKKACDGEAVDPVVEPKPGGPTRSCRGKRGALL